MTIYTSASRTHKPQHGICPDGLTRTKEALAKLGLRMESLVTMRLILDELGISDCVFSFCEVRKGCEAEADRVLRAYMQYIVELTQSYLGVFHECRGLNKRLAGIMRPATLETEYALITHLRESCAEPHKRKGLEVYQCLLSDKPNHLAAVHAGIALMDGAELIGQREQVQAKLRAKLEELMPAD